MKALQVTFVGPVRRPGPARSLTLDPSALGSVADLLSQLGYDQQEMAVLQVLAGGERLRPESPLEGVERVEILVAIGGG